MARLSSLLAAALGLSIPIGSHAAVAQPPHSQEIRSASEHSQSHHHPAPINKRTAQEVIAQLNLIPNVEKGYYVETFRDTDNGYSHWHRVDAVEVWHYYAGAPLTLSLSRDDGSPVREVKLGPDVFAGQQPQLAIGKWEWQRARSWGDWTLVGTTVAPGFDPTGFELAEPGWVPNGAA